MSLIAVTFQPTQQAWSAEACPSLVPQLKQSLETLSHSHGVQDFQALRTEKSQAYAEYLHAMEGLKNVRSSFAIELQVRAAHKAQVKYCEAHNALVKQGHEKYEIIPILEKYLGEDLGKSDEHMNRFADRFPQMAHMRIPYLTREERSSVRVHAQNGKLHFASGASLNKIHTALFAMNEKGEIYIVDTFGDPRFDLRNTEHRGYRHSSILGGEPVAAAGTISFDEHGHIKRSRAKVATTSLRKNISSSLSHACVRWA